MPVAPPPHNRRGCHPAVQDGRLLPEHVMPIVPPYPLHTGSPPSVQQTTPPREQQYGADLSSFCFLSSEPSPHPPPPSSSRRVSSPRPLKRDPLGEIRQPVKYLKILLRVVGHSIGKDDCGLWIAEVCYIRNLKYLDQLD